MAVGRISGPLLKDNLLRNGVNLAFETSLLYLDVKNGRVGVNTATPLYQLDVNGTTRTTTIEAANQATLASFTLTGNTISSTSSTINFVPSGANGVVYQGRATIGTQLAMTGNVISTVGTNVDLIINTTGTGQTKFNGNVLVNGDLHATGSITADGNLTLGDANTDNITFGGEITSDIVPDINNTYNLGSSIKKWLNIYAQTGNIVNANAVNLYTTTARTSALDFTGSTISTINTNTDINLISTGTGGTQIGNVRFSDNKITNVVAGAVTTIEQVTPATTWTGTVTQGTALTFTGLIAGTTLFVSTAPTGTIVPGQLLTGPGVQAGTYIVSNISGTGTGSTSQWTVNNTQTVASTTMTATPLILTASSVTGTISYKMVVTGGVSAGTYITGFGTGSGSAGTYYVTLTSLVPLSTAMSGTPLGGYVKFTGTNGVVIPVGTVGARPSQSEAEQGMIRYNTELNLVEMWTGSAWFSVAGSAAGVTADVATDIGIATALIIG